MFFEMEGTLGKCAQGFCCEGKLHLDNEGLLSRYSKHKEIYTYTRCGLLPDSAKRIVSGKEEHK